MAWIAVAPIKFIAARSANSASFAPRQSKGKKDTSKWRNNPPDPFPEGKEQALERITKDPENLFV